MHRLPSSTYRSQPAKAAGLEELRPAARWGWVVLQLLLGGAIAGCGFVSVHWPVSVESFFGILGLLIAVAAALLVVLGVLSLGSSFTPLPRPRARRRLRQGGILRLVVTLCTAAWS
jgi:protein-S-isoprenylcysteine O-methyltransferase Ste14